MCFSTIVDLLYAVVLHLKYVVLCVFKWRCFTLCVVQHLNGIDLHIFKWRQLTKGLLLNGFWRWATHGVCQRFKRWPKTFWCSAFRGYRISSFVEFILDSMYCIVSCWGAMFAKNLCDVVYDERWVVHMKWM